MAVDVEGNTREALLDAAEALFAAEGIENVTLASITRFAGQRNGGRSTTTSAGETVSWRPSSIATRQSSTIFG